MARAESMVVEKSQGRWRVSMRSIGFERFVGTVFMSVWLAGWVTPVVLLATKLLGSPEDSEKWALWGEDTQGNLVVLGVALLWFIGFVAALRELFMHLAGEDAVELAGTEVAVRRRAGPFRSTRQLKRSDVRGVRFTYSNGRGERRTRALVLETQRGSVTVTRLGSHEEREELGRLLASRLSVPGP
jgi:hypothetical protein